VWGSGALSPSGEMPDPISARLLFKPRGGRRRGVQPTPTHPPRVGGTPGKGDHGDPKIGVKNKNYKGFFKLCLGKPDLRPPPRKSEGGTSPLSSSQSLGTSPYKPGYLGGGSSVVPDRPAPVTAPPQKSDGIGTHWFEIKSNRSPNPKGLRLAHMQNAKTVKAMINGTMRRAGTITLACLV